MMAPIEAIAMEFQTVQEALSGLERINDFDREEEECRVEFQLDKEISNHLPISINNMTFAYDKDKNIIENISFNIEPGTKVALVGRTGAGKSTVLNLVSGLYKPS